jgi:hypothetical protein
MATLVMSPMTPKAGCGSLTTEKTTAAMNPTEERMKTMTMLILRRLSGVDKYR